MSDNNNSNNSNDLSNEMQRGIIAQMTEDWRRAAYGAVISAKVAARLDDDAMKKRAVEQLTRAEKALDVLREELEGLEQVNA